MRPSPCTRGGPNWHKVHKGWKRQRFVWKATSTVTTNFVFKNHSVYKDYTRMARQFFSFNVAVSSTAVRIRRCSGCSLLVLAPESMQQTTCRLVDSNLMCFFSTIQSKSALGIKRGRQKNLYSIKLGTGLEFEKRRMLSCPIFLASIQPIDSSPKATSTTE